MSKKSGRVGEGSLFSAGIVYLGYTVGDDGLDAVGLGRYSGLAVVHDAQAGLRLRSHSRSRSSRVRVVSSIYPSSSRKASHRIPLSRRFSFGIFASGTGGRHRCRLLLVFVCGILKAEWEWEVIASWEGDWSRGILKQLFLS